MTINTALLLGAGFSANWGGLVARQVTNDLMAKLQTDRYLRDLLNKVNFEDALARVQSEYLSSRTADSEKRLSALQDAIYRMFKSMNGQFQSRNFEFSNEKHRSVKRFLARFDAIFTLNQDLLLEMQYEKHDVPFWYETRWKQAWEMPGLRQLPLADRFDRTTDKWRPEEPFQSNPNMQPYYKLHGSIGWEMTDGQALLVIGRDKLGAISRHPILRWTYQRFEECLSRKPMRLMVIGYGFADDHINQTIIDAHQAGGLDLMYLVHPAGKAVLNRYPPGAIPLPQPLLDITCIECTVPISQAFDTNDLARNMMEQIFS
jgi:hypothetical protein